MKIDICFLMDITGSMETWLQAAKDQTFEIVRKTRETTPDAEIRVAFVGYRDYGDKPQYVCHEFGNVDDILDSIDRVHARGGDDQAEDVAGGLQNARMFVWDEDAAKLLVHIADAPPHGKKFHEPWVSDRFPEGDPTSINPLHLMHKFSAENVDYTFVKINDSTNIMLKEFHDVYTGPGQFEVIDLRPQVSAGVHDFGPSVFRSVTTTIMRHSASQDPSAV